MGPMQDIRQAGSFAETMQNDPEFWALRINAAWRRSLESVIEAGRLLIDAKSRLRHGQWETMVETGLDFSASTASRLMSIARDDRLSNPAHVQLLPRSYGTLYELTKLTDAEFTRGIDEKIIRPEMERKPDTKPSAGAPSNIVACRVVLLEGLNRVLARGVVAIDASGPPPIIFWEGDAYLPTLRVEGEQFYRKTKAFYAGASFEAVQR